jgi:hypothetical protein
VANFRLQDPKEILAELAFLLNAGPPLAALPSAAQLPAMTAENNERPPEPKVSRRVSRKPLVVTNIIPGALIIKSG